MAGLNVAETLGSSCDTCMFPLTSEVGSILNAALKSPTS